MLLDSTGNLLIVAGLSDGRILSWRLFEGTESLIEPTCTWCNPLSSSILFIGYLSQEGKESILCCCDAAGHVRLFDTAFTSLAHFHHPGKKKAMTASLAYTPWFDSVLVVACGCADGAIRLVFVTPSGQMSTEPACFNAHSDWVKSIDFCEADGKLYLLSGGQDSFVRVWVLQEPDLFASEGSASGTSLLLGKAEIALPATSVVYSREATAEGVPACSVTLDGVVLGHEDWVTCVCWDKRSPGEGFISCSADKSAILWSKQGEEWIPEARLGGVGGRSVGMLGCGLGQQPEPRLFTYGHDGILQTWHQQSSGIHTQSWTSHSMPCGHTDKIASFTVNEDRGYMMSVSVDQTARVWGTRGGVILAEAGRPVSHGYSLVDAAFVCSELDRHQFVLASAEKVARVFSCTRSFLSSLATFPDQAQIGAQLKQDAHVKGRLRAESAMVPELSLSSLASTADSVSQSADKVIAAKLAHEQQLKLQALGKVEATPAQISTPETRLYSGNAATSAGGADASEAIRSNEASASSWQPPSQEFLADSSQWIETHKLYYHGNDLSCLVSCSSRRLVLTACVARSTTHAALAVWHADSWKRLQVLEAHSSTINCIAVSPDENFVVTGGKDRQLALYAVSTTETEAPLTRIAAFRGHKREVSAVCWISASTFVSASKDGQAKVWSLAEDERGETKLSGGSSMWSTQAPIASLAAYRSTSNTLLALCTIEGTLMVLQVDPALGEAVCTWSSQRVLSGAAWAMTWFKSSLYVGGEDGCILQFASPLPSL